jgi:hypothetical protein
MGRALRRHIPRQSFYRQLIWAALNIDEANLVDLVKFGQSNRFSFMQLGDEISKLNLSGCYLSFDVPVFFLLGGMTSMFPLPCPNSIS